MKREPLGREDVIRAVERKGGGKIPLFLHKFWGEGLAAKYGEALERMASAYPDDFAGLWYTAPGEHLSTTGNPSYRWGYRADYSSVARHSIGEQYELLPDWSELDRFLEDFPDPDEPGTFDAVKVLADKAGNRYRLGCFWRLFHERFWSIRGMENLMLDYYDAMDNLKLVGRKLLEYYTRIIDRFAAIGADGIFTSDDLGHQRGPMMSPAVFEELYFPLYREFISYAHAKGMHVFLHSCGDNTLLMPWLIEAGLDVFHPVQTGCMDEAETVRAYGDRISFLAGVDVQHLLPEGSPEDVRRGVRDLIEVFSRSDGGLLLAMGNGIMPDTPLENIEAALDAMTVQD